MSEGISGNQAISIGASIASLVIGGGAASALSDFTGTPIRAQGPPDRQGNFPTVPGNPAIGNFVGQAIGVGVGILINLFQSPEDPEPTRREEPALLINEQLAQERIQNAWIVLGRALVNGEVRSFYDTSTVDSEINRREIEVDPDKNPGAILVTQYVMAPHKIHRYVFSRIGNQFINPDPNNYASRSKVFRNDVTDVTVVTTRRGNNVERREETTHLKRDYPYLHLSSQTGTLTQPIDPLLRRNFPDLPDTHRGAGFALQTLEFYNGHIRKDYERVWQSLTDQGFSGRRFSSMIEGVEVYDPRDPSQDPNDPTTFKWTENAALIIAFLLTQQLFLVKPVTYDSIDIPALIKAANICDVGVPAYDRYDGNGNRVLYEQKRYTISGVCRTNQTPKSMLLGLLLSCDGNLGLIGGKYHIQVGHRREPVATIHDNNVFGAITYTNGVPDDSKVGALSVRGNTGNARSNYEDDVMPLITDVPETEVKNTIKNLTINYASGISRLQRLGWIKFNRSKLNKTLAITMDNTGLFYSPGDILRFDSQKFPYANGLYELAMWVPNGRFGESFDMHLREYSHNIWDWDPRVQEKELDFSKYR